MSVETPTRQITIVVTIEVKPDRVEDFKEAAIIDAEGSRREEGCLRFDVIQCEDREGNLVANKFQFYEVYKDAAAHAHHRTTEHFAAWTRFKESGGVADGGQTVSKGIAISWTA